MELRGLVRKYEFDFEQVSYKFTEKAQIRGLSATIDAIATADKCRERYQLLDDQTLKRRKQQPNGERGACAGAGGSGSYCGAGGSGGSTDISKAVGAAEAPTSPAAAGAEQQDSDEEGDGNMEDDLGQGGSGEMFSKIKHNWYQNGTDVVLSLLQKGMR